MKRLLVVLLFCTFSLGNIFAHTEIKGIGDYKVDSSQPLGSESNPIKIGVVLVSPFASVTEGEYHGLVIDYWEHIAHAKNWHYVYIQASDNYNTAIKDLANGKYNIALGNFSSSYDRAQYVDFSRPYFVNNFSILTSVKSVGPFERFGHAIYSLLPVMTLVFGLFLIASVLFWWFEKRKRKYPMSKSLFHTSIAMICGEMGDEPSSNINRVVFVGILILGMILQAIIIASMTDSALSRDILNDPFHSEKDVAGKTFVVVKGSIFPSVLKSLDANVYEFDGSEVEAASYYIKNTDKYSGFVTEHILADRYAQKFKKADSNLIVSNVNLRNDALVFLYRKDFPYKKVVDNNILFMQDSNLTYSICATYIGEKADLCVL